MSLWDDVPDIEIPRHLIRSKPPFPDPAPELTAKVWERWRAERQAHLHPTEESDEEYEVTVTREAEEFDEPIKALATFVSLAHKSGWEIVELGHALAFAKGKPFKSGANEGKPRPDQEIETQWLYARKPEVGRIAVSYTIVNGTVRGNMTSRSYNGTKYSDRDFKAIIKGET